MSSCRKAGLARRGRALELISNHHLGVKESRLHEKLSWTRAAGLRDLLAFYQSPWGLRLLEVQPDLTRYAILAGQQWGMRLGAEIGQELAAEGIQVQP